MEGYQISICDYTFSIIWKTPKGQTRRETQQMKSSPLIGADQTEIIADPTGANQKSMRRAYLRANKGKKHPDGLKFNIVFVDVLKHKGKTTWIEKK